jgi:hypothetical protein
MGDDGFVRTAFAGDMTERGVEALVEDAQSFLEASSVENPTPVLHDSSRSGKFTSRARKAILTFFADPRIGKIAVTGARPYTRVLLSFLNRASGRKNMRLFATEQEALAWIKAAD